MAGCLGINRTFEKAILLESYWSVGGPPHGTRVLVPFRFGSLALCLVPNRRFPWKCACFAPEGGKAEPGRSRAIDFFPAERGGGKRGREEVARSIARNENKFLDLEF